MENEESNSIDDLDLELYKLKDLCTTLPENRPAGFRYPKNIHKQAHVVFNLGGKVSDLEAATKISSKTLAAWKIKAVGRTRKKSKYFKKISVREAPEPQTEKAGIKIVTRRGTQIILSQKNLMKLLSSGLL